MIDRQQFELIERKHGGYASWAVWAGAGRSPKSNVDDLSILDVAATPTTLQVPKNDIVMVGLNISRSFTERFRNFHDPSPSANDFKIRYAFTNTEFYGSYMTDIMKNVELVNSAELLKHLKACPSLVRTNVEVFREELRDLGSQRPTILAFGAAAHALISQNISRDEYSSLVRLTHYSHQIGKEKYREMVLAQISSQLAEACSQALAGLGVEDVALSTPKRLSDPRLTREEGSRNRRTRQLDS